MKAFVINLDRRPDRLAKITWALGSIDLEFQRVSAVDGRELHLKEHVRPWMAWLYEGFSYPLTGAVGCYLSHLKIWRNIINEDIDQAMVLEDDVLLHRWDKDILRINLGSYEIDLLRIGLGEQRYQSMKDSIATNVSRSETKICSRRVFFSRVKTASAYIITNKGA
jgi:glycosyl transferase, family 25